jgi:hypothetical protein
MRWLYPHAIALESAARDRCDSRDLIKRPAALTKISENTEPVDRLIEVIHHIHTEVCAEGYANSPKNWRALLQYAK